MSSRAEIRSTPSHKINFKFHMRRSEILSRTVAIVRFVRLPVTMSKVPNNPMRYMFSLHPGMYKLL